MRYMLDSRSEFFKGRVGRVWYGIRHQVFERVEELIRFRYLRSEVVGIRFEMKCNVNVGGIVYVRDKIAWKVFKCRRILLLGLRYLFLIIRRYIFRNWGWRLRFFKFELLLLLSNLFFLFFDYLKCRMFFQPYRKLTFITWGIDNLQVVDW